MKSSFRTARDVIAALQAYAKPDDAIFLQRFFKTGAGQYGEGDRFIGVRVPDIRRVCKAAPLLPYAEVQKLLDSPVHEHRLAGAIILTYHYPMADGAGKQAIFELYLKNVRAGQINNWDIVDATAENIIGRHLLERHLPRDILFDLAKNHNIWQRRVAIMSSFYFFRNGGKDASTTLQLCELLLHDSHDLIQKAVGWMLREVGKRVDRQLLIHFLDQHAATMPRTALRYAIEHLSPEDRGHYMGMKQRSQRAID